MVPRLSKPLFLPRTTQDCIMLCHASDNVLVRRVACYRNSSEISALPFALARPVHWTSATPLYTWPHCFLFPFVFLLICPLRYSRTFFWLIAGIHNTYLLTVFIITCNRTCPIMHLSFLNNPTTFQTCTFNSSHLGWPSSGTVNKNNMKVKT